MISRGRYFTDEQMQPDFKNDSRSREQNRIENLLLSCIVDRSGEQNKQHEIRPENTPQTENSSCYIGWTSGIDPMRSSATKCQPTIL